MTDRPKLGAMFAAPATERPAALAGLLAADPEPTDRPHPAPAAGHVANRSTASDRSAGKTRSSRGRATSRADPGVADARPSHCRNKIVPVVLDASVLTELRAFASRTEQTQGNVALRAIEAHAEELQEHWRTPKAPSRPVCSPSLHSCTVGPSLACKHS